MSASATAHHSSSSHKQHQQQLQQQKKKKKRDNIQGDTSSSDVVIVAASEKQVTKTKSVVKPSDAVVFTQTATSTTTTSKQPSKKRRATEIIQTEVPLSERLSAEQVHAHHESLSADSLVTLLTQGLQSNDATLLDQVLSCRNEKTITKTVRALPIPVLLPLLEQLNKLLYQNADRGLVASKWLRSVLSTHTSYLMTCSDIADRLGPMYELIEARTRLYPKLSRLHGKLTLIASQMNSHNESTGTNSDNISTKPSFVFEDASDDDQLDEEKAQDELVPSPSEYDDYSGLSDDLDLQQEDEVEENEQDDDDQEEEEANESDEEDDAALFNGSPSKRRINGHRKMVNGTRTRIDNDEEEEDEENDDL